MDCTIRLWSTNTGKCLRIYHGHKHWVKSVRFASDSQYIISCSLDRRIYVWNIRSALGVGKNKTHKIINSI
jgi:WD40 repeat protein